VVLTSMLRIPCHECRHKRVQLRRRKPKPTLLLRRIDRGGRLCLLKRKLLLLRRRRRRLRRWVAHEEHNAGAEFETEW
jgi:hypothetical protein